MRICAERHPIEVRTRPDQRVSCWLHGPEGEVGEGETEPLERAEIATAEEA